MARPGAVRDGDVEDRVDDRPQADRGNRDDDVDHFTCCDPSYYLATDRPVYSFCGRRLTEDDQIKLDLDDTPLCRLCLQRARTIGPGDSPCDTLCPQLLFG